MTPNTLGDFELAVLLSVSRLGETAYGLRVRQDVSALRQREYSVGAIYTTLQRLEDKSFLDSWMSDPIAVRGGRSRRHYRVTAAGRRAIHNARELSARLWSALDTGAAPA